MATSGASKARTSITEEPNRFRVVIRLNKQRPEQIVPEAQSQEVVQTAARLQVLLGATGKVVAVTGVAENDGSSLLVGCLGSGLATTSGSSVLLIDANVESPHLHEMFHVALKPGLLDLLEDELQVESAAHPQESSNLFVLPLGQSEFSLPALLSKPGSKNILDSLRAKYRYIVIDVGLLGSHPDGVLLASLSDGVVAAAAAGVRRRQEVQQLREQLKTLHIPLLGVVLTQQA
jgi:Mrp family chromosome partitioning ATPase